MKWIWIILLLPGLSFAGENCVSFGGVCKDACAKTEVAEQGAFIDCSPEELCCVSRKEEEELEIKCCIFSFSAGNYGPDNCGLPENNACSTGGGSPLDCSDLVFCRSR